jgi:hypothetical protein
MGEVFSLRESFPHIESAFYARCCCLAGDFLEHCAQKWVPVLRKNNATYSRPESVFAFQIKDKTL